MLLSLCDVLLLVQFVNRWQLAVALSAAVGSANTVHVVHVLENASTENNIIIFRTRFPVLA